MRRAELRMLIALSAATLARGCGPIEDCGPIRDYCARGRVFRFVDETTVAVRLTRTENVPWYPTQLDGQLSISLIREQQVVLRYVKDGQPVVETWRVFDPQLCPR